MSRVLIGQSYFLRFDTKLWSAMQPYAPLGSLYAAALLRQDGHEVTLFDAMLAESEADWTAALHASQPDVAVLFEDNFNYLSKMCLLRMREAAFRMLATARSAGCLTVACGSDATDHAEAYLDAGADHVVVGEGEATLQALLRELRSAGSEVRVETIGIRRRAADGTVVSTGRRENLKDLDALPLPAWDLIDVERYRVAWERHGRFSMNIATTRGCPFRCNWCAKPIWGNRYASRSPEHVADEIELLRTAYRADHFNIVDDIFGLRPDWLAEFADIVQRRRIVTPFKCLSRADLLLRDGEIDALRAAGCETVWIGAESGAQSILDAMDKGTKVEQIIEAARRLHEAGIRVGFFLQFGYPGEGIEEIGATRALIRTASPDDIGISVSYPLPGTPFHDRVRADLGDRQNWQDSDDLSMLYQGPYSTETYRSLHRLIHIEFRLQQAGRPSLLALAGRCLRIPPTRTALARLRDGLNFPIAERRFERRVRTEDRARPTPQTADGTR